jgi:hypothetical protein
MRLGVIAVWCCWFVEGDLLCGESVDILGDRFLIEIKGDLIKLTPETNVNNH